MLIHTEQLVNNILSKLIRKVIFMSKNTIGERILSIRGKESRKDFAERMEIGTATLQRYENDERLPDVSFLIRLHQETGLSLDYLILGKEQANFDNKCKLNEKIQELPADKQAFAMRIFEFTLNEIKKEFVS